MKPMGLLRVAAATLTIAAGTMLVAAPAAKPVKLATSKPYGSGQTNATIDDAAVEGKVLRVTVTKPDAKPWEVGMTSIITEKLKAGDRISATLWLRASQVQPGKTGKVSANIALAEPPRTNFGRAEFTLTDRFAPYKLEATIPADMASHKVSLSLQIAYGQQTIDVASVAAVNQGPAS
ncbi:MAG TPA: hypothetical protein VF695_02975 [Sphingomonas sp.]|jgi:hypothetical protein